MERVRSKIVIREVLHQWSDEWRAEHIGWIEDLKDAIDRNDMIRIKIVFAQLRILTENKHNALHNIWDLLIDKEWN